MIEEAETPAAAAPRDVAPEARYGEALLYDFSKFLISLSLLALGAMLTLGQAAKTGQVELPKLFVFIATLSLAGIIAFAVGHAVVDARARGVEPPKRLPLYLKAATGLLGIGVGGFLYLWLDTLA